MFLQSLVFGYGGLRFNDNGISMDPLLPPGVTAMKLRGKQTALFEPFIYKMHYFTKTGSGRS
jgi:trehalose/maltose hydrolase-like predicted phosphorylase